MGRQKEGRRAKCFVCGSQYDRPLRKKYSGCCKPCYPIFSMLRIFSKKSSSERKEIIRKEGMVHLRKLIINVALEQGKTLSEATWMAKKITAPMVQAMQKEAKSIYGRMV